MSEVDSRPAPTRGRSSHRGGRGGFGRGGPRGGRKPINGTTDIASVEESIEDQGELGEMKKKYADELVILKDMFPDWTDVDLVFALQETDGDVPSTVDKITQGNVSQFSEVKNAKDRARSKVKESSATPGTSDKSAARGGRGRGGHENSRGTRGRASDRGRGGFKGARGGHATTNGSAKEAGTSSVPTAESTAWDDSSNVRTIAGAWDNTTSDATGGTTDAGQSALSNVVAPESNPPAVSEATKTSLIPEGGPKKSWASMFAPKPAPAPVKKAPPQQPPPGGLMATGAVPGATELPEARAVEDLPPPPAINEPPLTETYDASEATPPILDDGDELTITPSKVPLTEENVEHLPDESHPPATQTAASTTGSIDPRNLTPLPGQQAPIARPPMGGYATSAYRATGAPGRSASFQRRVQEQQESVVMPGHNAVDRATVQFGSMGLNGEPGPDVDDDREEPETRQAPQHSPPSQPRTSLPPMPRQAGVMQDVALPEYLPTPKQAPGLPPASQVNQQQTQDTTLPPNLQTEVPQMAQQYNQYGRYGAPPSMQQDSGVAQQKPYDQFSHQTQPTQYDQYGMHSQQASQQPQHSQAGFGGLSSAPNDMSQYYTSDQQRSAYSSYYGGSYGPQDARSHSTQGQQDAGLGQQRSASGFGAGPNDSAFGSQQQQQVSTSPTLLQLNAALECSNNEDERRYLLDAITRKVAKQQETLGTRSTALRPTVLLNTAKTVQPLASGLQQISPPAAVFSSDVTNLIPHLVYPQHKYKQNISNLPSQQQAQSRFADSTNSGNNTPNPPMGGPQHGGPNAPQAQQNMHQASSHQQQSGYGNAAGYPYGHPYYTSPYQQAYQNQFNYNQQMGGYGSYPNKHAGGMYGQSHGYGMNPQSSYDQHTASPANTGAFGQNQQTSMRSASGMSSGMSNLDDYGRSSAQSHQQSSGFGGMTDAFARSGSGFGGAQGGYGQQSIAGQEDSLKPFNDNKGGPSPALGQPGARPGSAANSAAGSTQSGLPPPQSHQSGFGGYAGFPGQSQYGSLGGLGGQQQQQPHSQSNMGAQGGYGSYAGNSFNQTYGGYSRGGWGSNYGAH